MLLYFRLTGLVTQLILRVEKRTPISQNQMSVLRSVGKIFLCCHLDQVTWPTVESNVVVNVCMLSHVSALVEGEIQF